MRRWIALLLFALLLPLTAAAEPAQPVYRALVIGEQNYMPEDVSDRDGAIHTAEGMRDMLLSLSMDYAVQLETDIGADAALAAIETAFAGAQDGDVSLFYVNCHGYYRSGVAWLEFSDGSALVAGDLERALRNVPGTVVVIVDACNSGGFIGAGETEFPSGFTDAFAGAAVSGGFHSSKYKVICSSGREQQSYRLGFAGADVSESTIGTVLARCLCEGAGWDFIGDKRSAMRADADFDGVVSLSDMQVFLDQRIEWYLAQTGGAFEQNVQVYPENDGFVLFRREN